MPLPDLTTERLILRQLKDEDAAEIFLLRSDEDVNRYLDRPIALTIEDALAFIHKINTGINDNGWLYWAISTKDDPSLLGTICIFNTDVEKGTAEIGYELLPSCQGKGFMQEAISKAIVYGFETLGLNTIEAVLHANNENSIKVLKKYNFKRDPDAESKMDESDRLKGMIAYTLQKPDSHL